MSERLLLGALCLMIVAVPLVPGRLRFGRIVLDAVVVAVPLVVAAALVHMRARGHSRVPGLLIGLPMAAFLVVALVSALVGVQPAGSLLTWARYAAYPLIALGFAMACLRPASRRLLLWLFAGTAAVTVLIAFAQYLDPSGPAGAFGFSRDVSTRVFATFGNPNSFSEYLLVAISVAGVLAVTEKGWPKWLALALAAGSGAALVLTFTRGSWLALAVGVLAASALVSWKLLAYFSGAVAVALVVVRGALDRLLSIGTLDAGAESRLSLWRLALEMASRRLAAGYGPGNYLPAVQSAVAADPGLYTGPLDTLSTHNTFLLILAETGVLGLSAFLWLVGAMVAGCVSAARKVRDHPSARWENAVLTVGIIGFAVNGLTDISYQNPRAAVFLWMLLGLQAALVSGCGQNMGSRRILDSRLGRMLLPDPAPCSDTRKEGATS